MATPKTPAGTSDKKFFDVAKPGKSMPPSTSRPAIVGHRTLLKDPMVNGPDAAAQEKPADTTPPAEEPTVSTTAPTLKPINLTADSATDNESPAEPTETTVSVVAAKKAEAPEPAVPIAEPDEAPDEAPTEPESTEEPGVTEEAKDDSTDDAVEQAAPEPTAQDAKPAEASDGALSGSSEATAEAESMVAKNEAEKQAAKAAEEAAAKVEAAEKLIADKTYFVPVGEHRHRRSKKHTGLLVVCCLLAIVALGYLAIDSGMIETSIELPVRLFRVE